MDTTREQPKRADNEAGGQTAIRGRVCAVSISSGKGTRKTPVESALFVPGKGIEGDAHSGQGHRQVSLLSLESIEKMREKGLNVGPGDFAENVTVTGLELHTLPVGTEIRLGKSVILELTQVGKECIDRCSIYYQAGDCVMPREGIFATVLAGGVVRPGDEVAADRPREEPK